MQRETINLALTAVLGLTLLAGAGCESRSEACAKQGGTVQKDVETKYEVKSGTRTVKTVTEYECIAPDGTELFEWK